jgi:hypothetical protein
MKTFDICPNCKGNWNILDRDRSGWDIGCDTCEIRATRDNSCCSKIVGNFYIEWYANGISNVREMFGNWNIILSTKHLQYNITEEKVKLLLMLM